MSWIASERRHPAGARPIEGFGSVPEVGGSGNGGYRNGRNFVFVSDPGSLMVVQLARQHQVVEAEDFQVEVRVLQSRQFLTKHLLVPRCIERALVIGSGEV